MREQQEEGDVLQGEPLTGTRGKILRFYDKSLDFMVIALIFVTLLTLLGAVAGLALNFLASMSILRDDVAAHGLVHVHRVADGLGRHLVIDVLSTFVLMELFRTFTDYLEFRRIRLRELAEVGIVFVVREMFIGLYAHRMDWPELLAISVLLAVLVAARVAAVQFPPQQKGA